VPERIDALTRHTLYDSQATAETAMRETEEITKMEWAKVVAATAEKVARDTATTPKGQWLTTGITVAALVVLATVGAGYALGKDAGLAEATGIARDEAAAATWANTPDGQLAYRWAQTSKLQRLARSEDQTLTRDRQQGRAGCLAKKGSRTGS